MTWTALVPPRKNTVDLPGMCLRFAQSFFGAPVKHRSAWEAWQNQTYRHPPSDPLPNVPVLLWYSHWGTYGDPLSYENWGHVTPYVPGDAIYSSPDNPYAGWSQSRFSTIAEVERAFNCKYVGWSEDINGLRVAENVKSLTGTNPTKPHNRNESSREKKDREDMIFIYLQDGVRKGEHAFAVFKLGQKGSWWEFSGQPSANQLAGQLGNAMRVWPGPWNDLKKRHK